MKRFLHLELWPRKIDRTIALSALVILLAVAWILTSWDKETRYHGRALSAWLEDLDEGKASDVRSHASTVLTEAASKAAPQFARALRAKDSKITLLINALAQRLNVIHLTLRTAAIRRDQAMNEFSRFQVGAIPVLTNLLEDPALALDAVRTMNCVGPEATVYLLRALAHTNGQVRLQAAMGLDSVYENCVRFKNFVTQNQGWQGTYPTNAIVAALVALLKDKYPNVSEAAAYALGDIREQIEKVIPALTQCLHETTSARVLQAAADALGKYGPEAFSAVPSLQPLFSDIDPEVRSIAERALKKINEHEKN
jgi:HEAT repeat protein